MDFVLTTNSAASLLPGGLFSEPAPNPCAVVADDGGFDLPINGSKSSTPEAPEVAASSNLSRSVESRTSGSDNGALSSLADHDDAPLTAPAVAAASPTVTATRPKTNKMPAVSAACLEALLAASANAEAMCPADVEIGVYNSDMSQHYAIPSEDVQITRGAIKYVDHHTRYGAQTRFRFQLCHNFLLRKCPKLSECSYIHATQLPAPTQVHLNPFAPRRLAADRHGRSNEVAPSVQDDPSVTDAYERLAAGATLEVHPPQGNQVSADVTVVASENVFLTVGATDALKQLEAADGDAKRIEGAPPRHCTKFQYRRACPAGPTCKGIHSAVPFAGTSLSALHQTQPARTTDLPSQAAQRPAKAFRPAGAAQGPAQTQLRVPANAGAQLPPAFVSVHPQPPPMPMMQPMLYDPSQGFSVFPQHQPPQHGHMAIPHPAFQMVSPPHPAGSWFHQQQVPPMAPWAPVVPPSRSA